MAGKITPAQPKMQAWLAALISFVIPFLGLYFIWPIEKRTMALTFIGAGVLIDIISFGTAAALLFGGGVCGLFSLFGCLLWLGIPVVVILPPPVHLVAAAYTYLEAGKQQLS